MKRPLVLAIFASLALAGCNDSGGGSDVAALQRDVAQLKQSDQDLRLKMQLAGRTWGSTPLQDFFAAPEFWENTYDSGSADCARRCQTANKPLRDACASKPESQRQQCYTDASNSLAQCVQRC